MHIRWLHERELGSVQHYDAQKIVRVKISNVMRRQPRWGAIWREGYLQIGGQVIQPGIKRWIELHKFRVDTPFLPLLDSSVDNIHSPNIANDPCEVGKIARNMVLGIVNSWCRPGNAQVQRIYIDCQIRPAFR